MIGNLIAALTGEVQRLRAQVEMTEVLVAERDAAIEELRELRAQLVVQVTEDGGRWVRLVTPWERAT